MAEFVFEKQPEFVERDGKYVLDIPDGVPASEFTAVKTSLTDYQSKYEQANQKLSGFGDLTPEQITQMKTALEAYKKDGNPDDLKLKLAEYEQKVKSYESKVGEYEGKVQELTAYKQKREIGKAIKAAAKEAKIPDEFSAVLDTWANCFTLNGENKPISNGKGGFPAGLTPKQFTEQALAGQYAFMQAPSQGGGSKSVKGGNNKSDDEPATMQDLMSEIWNKG